jgi:hypothetical protein
VSLHPGFVRSSIGNGHVFEYVTYVVGNMVGKSVKQGAQTTLHCTLAKEEMVNGKYYRNCRVEWDRFTTKYADDDVVVKKAYEKTKKMLGLEL